MTSSLDLEDLMRVIRHTGPVIWQLCLARLEPVANVLIQLENVILRQDDRDIYVYPIRAVIDDPLVMHTHPILTAPNLRAGTSSRARPTPRGTSRTASACRDIR